MFQGTGSDVGKSLVVAGLCRALKRRRRIPQPFKPQNMSNNAAVTEDGGEIGRAQELQARAAGVVPTVHMNPVLLKPQSESGSQVIVHGKVYGRFKAIDYYQLKPRLLESVMESFEIIKKNADIVLVEGAGSPAEVNLRHGDIANMGFAEVADVPVILIADIDRGGVIASLVGTHAVLSESERTRVKGFIVNKFKGDKSLFDDGIKIVREKTGWQCFGVIPYLPEVNILPKEDSMFLDSQINESSFEREIKIAVPRLSRIANFDDLDPLSSEPDVSIRIIDPNHPIPSDTDIILLPGSKSTISDLQLIREKNWDIDILAHFRLGKVVIGLCGGFQILGKKVIDPDGIEGVPGEIRGLGLLDVNTMIDGDKTLKKVSGTEILTGAKVSGYEMHIGTTIGPDMGRPWFRLSDNRDEGALSRDGLIFGTYMHGLFASDQFRGSFLNRFRSGAIIGSSYENKVEEALDQLAINLEKHLDVDLILSL